jgi:hypothetical protein
LKLFQLLKAAVSSLFCSEAFALTELGENFIVPTKHYRKNMGEGWWNTLAAYAAHFTYLIHLTSVAADKRSILLDQLLSQKAKVPHILS